MKTAVTHINLLQRSGPTRPVALALVVLLAATLLGMLAYGASVVAQARGAEQQRDAVAQQLKRVQQQLAVQTGETARSAAALQLRGEADALQPQADLAQALMAAVRAADSGRTEEFSRPLSALARVSEPGLWLTALTVSAGGRKVEVQGQAASGSAVLRFAGRANDALQPLTLRLDSLEMQPPPGAAPAGGASGGLVAFKLY